jgi:hypothetical protein
MLCLRPVTLGTIRRLTCDKFTGELLDLVQREVDRGQVGPAQVRRERARLVQQRAQVGSHGRILCLASCSFLFLLW